MGGGEQYTELPLFYLDAMLPRQRMRLNIFEPRFCVRRRIYAYTRTHARTRVSGNFAIAFFD